MEEKALQPEQCWRERLGSSHSTEIKMPNVYSLAVMRHGQWQLTNHLEAKSLSLDQKAQNIANG